MKTSTLFALLLTLSIFGSGLTTKSAASVNGPDSLTLGPGYSNDVYFSFENGVVAEVPRANWDIAFHTTVWTASIITNGGSGVNLYVYPNSDTAGWATVDTAGMAAWPALYDNEDDREDGAFNRGSAGHPDYGWGKYNPINHDVVGDSLYIIKTLSGAYKKIWILRKNSIANTYYLRYANLDGSEEKNMQLAINPHRNRNFIHYSFATDAFVEREPDTASWDIHFTKYMAIQSNGTPYSVVGVQNNFKVYGNQFQGVGPDFTDWTSQPLDSTLSPIGWEWKTFDMNTFTWTVADSNAFFVQTRTQDIWKLVFTRFDGSTTGKIVFETLPVSLSSTGDPLPAIDRSISVYPNPVSDRLNIELGENYNGPADIRIYDITGKQVFRSESPAQNGNVSLVIQDAGLLRGIYVLKVTAGTASLTSRIMVYPR